MRTEHDILSYLRSKPRHGKQNDEGKKEIQNKLQEVKEAFGEASSYGDQYEKVLKSLNETTGLANRALNVSVGLYEQYRNNLVSVSEKMTFLEQRNKNLAKALNLNSARAKDFADKLRALNVGLGDDKLFKFTANLNKLTGGFINTTKATNLQLASQLKVQRYLVENLELTEEQANKFTLFAAAQGKSSQEAVESTTQLGNALAKAFNIEETQAQTMILGDIADLSADIRNQYGQMPGLLETAVLKSRLLGVSMQQLFNTGKGLLDIQSAVGNEIELQLLSGRKLNVQNSEGAEVNFMAAYREATLTSNAAEQQTLLNNMLLKEGETLQTNFMYREKMATALGMSTESLMNAVEKANLIEQLGMSELIELDAKDLEAKILELKKDGNTDERLDDLLKTTTKKTLSEQLLENIDSKISQFISSNVTGSNAENFDFSIGGTASKAMGTFSEAITNFATQFTQTKFTKALSALQNVSLASSAIYDPIKDFAPNKITKAIEKIGDVTSLGTANIDVSGDVNIGPAAVADVKATPRDAILFDPMDEIVTVASTDRGQLENTVNNMMSGNVSNNTNVTIDYNAMANAIATAMTRVKLNINESNNYRNTFNA